MLPAYSPEPFKNLDLRKYHVRDIKDVIRFIEFISTRLDESKHILNKFNTRYNTLNAVVKQMQSQQQKINDMYGAPEGNRPELKPEDQEKAVIQTSEEDKTAAKEREFLLDEMKKAVANDSVQGETKEETDEKLTVEFEKYKLVQGVDRGGNPRLMFFREGKLTAERDIPDDVVAMLKETLNGVRNSGQDNQD